MELNKLTTEMENYYHIKYGFSLTIIKNIWQISNNAEEVTRNFEASISLSKNLRGI